MGLHFQLTTNRMKLLIQRVKHASVQVNSQTIGKINKGLLVFVGVDKSDRQADIDLLTEKLVQLRIFEDEKGKMNCSALNIRAEFLVVSQFTLLADCRKGRRPSFDRAAAPQKGEELYEAFVEKLRSYGLKVETGRFRAMMEVSLINDGPVTLMLDSFRLKEPRLPKRKERSP